MKQPFQIKDPHDLIFRAWSAGLDQKFSEWDEIVKDLDRREGYHIQPATVAEALNYCRELDERGEEYPLDAVLYAITEQRSGETRCYECSDDSILQMDADQLDILWHSKDPKN